MTVNRLECALDDGVWIMAVAVDELIIERISGESMIGAIVGRVKNPLQHEIWDA